MVGLRFIALSLRLSTHGGEATWHSGLCRAGPSMRFQVAARGAVQGQSLLDELAGVFSDALGLVKSQKRMAYLLYLPHKRALNGLRIFPPPTHGWWESEAAHKKAFDPYFAT